MTQQRDHTIGDVGEIELMLSVELTTCNGQPETATAAAVQQVTTRFHLLAPTCWLPPAGSQATPSVSCPALAISHEKIRLGLERPIAALDVLTATNRDAG